MKRERINKYAIPFALIALVATLGFGGCKSHMIDEEQAGDGTGSLTVSVADAASARLVIPVGPAPSAVTSYAVTLSRAGYATRESGTVTDLSSLMIQALDPGDWTVTLAGFDATSAKIVEGSSSVTIERDRTAAAAIALAPVFPRTAGGTGSVSLSFACQGFLATAGGWAIDFAPCAGGSSVTYVSASPGVTVTSGSIALSASLPSGDWDMTVRVQIAGTEYVTLTDTVKVYDGKTSVYVGGGSIALSTDDLVKAGLTYYVAASPAAGNTGRDRAHACTLIEAIAKCNARSDLSDSNPALIVLTENVIVSLGPTSSLSIARPVKIISLSTSPCSITCANDTSSAFIDVASGGGNTGRLTVERATITIASGRKAASGLVRLTGSDGLAALTLKSGATLTGNKGTMLSGAGGVNLKEGVCVMEAGSTISGNNAMLGGGVFLGTALAKLTMDGGSINGNRSAGSGGGVHSDIAGATIEINGGSITGNSANIDSWNGVGGGILVQSESDLVVNPSIAGGWKDVVTGNTGVGPDVIRCMKVANAGSIPSLSTTYLLPVELRLIWTGTGTPSAMTINNPANTFVITSQGTSPEGQDAILCKPSNPTSSLFSISAGTVYIDAPIVSASTSGVSICQVSGTGTLVMCEKGSIKNAIISGNPGGAIELTNGTFKMEGGVIENNQALGMNGGAIVISGGTATISEGLIRDNLAGAYGGAIWLSGGSLTITGGRIGGNTAQTSGGAIYVNGGSLSMSGGEIGYYDSGYKSNVSTEDGGGICASAGTVSISGAATVHYNHATNSGRMGGGIAMIGTSVLTVAGNLARIEENQADRAGGGVFLKNSATMMVPDTTWSTIIQGNSANLALPDLARECGTVASRTAIDAALLRSEPVIMTVSGSPIDLSTSIVIAKAVAIIGGTSGFRRTTGMQSSLLSIANGGTLTLSGDLTIDGNNEPANSALVDVAYGGTCLISDQNVRIMYGNNTTGNGGGVRVAGKFILKNGMIGQDGLPNSADGGAGAFVTGNGVMEMSGGEIRYNFAGSSGGGVMIDGPFSKFYFSGGSIHHNVADSVEGAGIFLGEGAVYINNPSPSHPLNGAITINQCVGMGGGIYQSTQGVVYFSALANPTAGDWVPVTNSTVGDASNTYFRSVFVSNNLDNYSLR